MRTAAIALGMMAMVAACGGSDGAPGSTGAAGATGAQGAAGGSGSNADGGASSTAGVKPAHAPSGITFGDIDPATKSVNGIIAVQKAAVESDITSYAVYYGASATKKLYLTPIFVAPVTGSDVSYPLDIEPPPAGATNLIAFSQNAAGEMATGVATPFHDGVLSAADISAGEGTGSGAHPSMAIDAVNGKILVATEDQSNSGKPTLFRCNLDGTSCTHTDISAGQGTGSGFTPSLAIDAVNGKVLVVTDDGSNADKPSLFRCNLDGTSCAHVDISVGQGSGSGVAPSLAIDAADGKLLVATQDESIASKPSLFRCNLDGTSCTHTDISAGRGTSCGLAPSIAVDATNAKLLVATDDGSNLDKLTLFRCNLDATSCTSTDISDGQGAGSGVTPALVVDAVNGKLNVATENEANANKPSLFRCNLNVLSCTHNDISAGQGPNAGVAPSIAIDNANNKLLVVTEDNSSSNRPTLFRCGLDDLACVAFDISAGQSSPAVGPSLAINAGQYVVAVQNAVPALKPELYFLQ